MAKFCTGCGKEIADGVAFCTECGTPAPKDEAAVQQPVNEPAEAAPQPASEPQAVPQATEQPQHPPQPPQQQHYSQQTYAQPEITPKGGKFGVVGTGAFFWLMLLYAVPVIGFIACIIMAFAPQNENIKHFARAFLIWLIVGTVLTGLAVLAFIFLAGSLKDYINGLMPDWQKILGEIDLSGIDLSGIPTY